MLVLTRKAKQSIMIGDDVELLAAVDHGREGPPRDPGPAGDPGVPQGDLLGDPATEPRGRDVGAHRGGRRAHAVERTQQPLLSKPPAGFTTEEQPFSSVRRHGPAGSLVSIAATSTNAGYGALVRSCHRPTTCPPTRTSLDASSASLPKDLVDPRTADSGESGDLTLRESGFERRGQQLGDRRMGFGVGSLGGTKPVPSSPQLRSQSLQVRRHARRESMRAPPW
jgi:hypothetical protein